MLWKKVVLTVPLILLLFIGCYSEFFSEEACYKELKAIAKASKQYYEQFKIAPTAPYELEEAGYIKLNEKVQKEWKIFIYYPEEVVAISTIRNPKGEGKELKYEFPQVY